LIRLVPRTATYSPGSPYNNLYKCPLIRLVPRTATFPVFPEGATHLVSVDQVGSKDSDALTSSSDVATGVVSVDQVGSKDSDILSEAHPIPQSSVR